MGGQIFQPVTTQQFLKAWNTFRIEDQFTDVQIYCQDMRCVSLHSAILATCSPTLGAAMTEAGSDPADGTYTVMLPDTTFEEVLSLVGVLYGEINGLTPTPTEELLSMLAFRPELFEVGISVVDGGDQAVAGYGDDIIVKDELWPTGNSETGQTDDSEAEIRPPKRRRKLRKIRKIASSSSSEPSPMTTDNEEETSLDPPVPKSKKFRKCHKVRNCTFVSSEGDSEHADNAKRNEEEFNDFVRNLSQGTALLLPKNGKNGLDLDTLVNSALEEIITERLIGV